MPQKGQGFGSSWVTGSVLMGEGSDEEAEVGVGLAYDAGGVVGVEVDVEGSALAAAGEVG